MQRAAGELRRAVDRLTMSLLLQRVVDPLEDAIGQVRNVGKATPAEITRERDALPGLPSDAEE